MALPCGVVAFGEERSFAVSRAVLERLSPLAANTDGLLRVAKVTAIVARSVIVGKTVLSTGRERGVAKRALVAGVVRLVAEVLATKGTRGIAFFYTPRLEKAKKVMRQRSGRDKRQKREEAEETRGRRDKETEERSSPVSSWDRREHTGL